MLLSVANFTDETRIFYFAPALACFGPDRWSNRYDVETTPDLTAKRGPFSLRELIAYVISRRWSPYSGRLSPVDRQLFAHFATLKHEAAEQMRGYIFLANKNIGRAEFCFAAHPSFHFSFIAKDSYLCTHAIELERFSPILETERILKEATSLCGDLDDNLVSVLMARALDKDVTLRGIIKVALAKNKKLIASVGAVAKEMADPASYFSTVPADIFNYVVGPYLIPPE